MYHWFCRLPLNHARIYKWLNFIFHRADGVHHHVPAEELPCRRPSPGGGPRVGEGFHRLHEAMDHDRDAGKLCFELKPPNTNCVKMHSGGEMNDLISVWHAGVVQHGPLGGGRDPREPDSGGADRGHVLLCHAHLRHRRPRGGLVVPHLLQRCQGELILESHNLTSYD